MEDCSSQKRFCSNEQATFRYILASDLVKALELILPVATEYAAAFFILGGSLKDAVSVCIKQLKDFQLAVTLARIMENGDTGPVLEGILTSAVLPLAFEDGNRWLACWAFWLLNRRDLSVRILMVCSISFVSSTTTVSSRLLI